MTSPDSHPILRLMLRYLRIACEVFAAFIGIMVVLGLLLAWRLNNGPISSGLLTPYIESTIEGMIPGSQASIANTLLTWDSENHSIALHADSIHVADGKGVTIAELPSMGVRLSALGIMFGQFIPTELIVDHLQLKIDHKKDGSYYFGGDTPDAVANGVQASGDVDFIYVLERAINNLAHAYITNKLNISRTVIDVHDDATNSNWAISVPEISLHRSGLGLVGTAVVDVTQKSGASSIKINYNYDRLRGLHSLSSHFVDITPSFFAGGNPETLGLGGLSAFSLPLSGNIEASITDEMIVQRVTAKIHADAGTLTYPDLWKEPRAIKSADLTASYDHIAHKLDESTLHVDFGGTTLDVIAKGTKPTEVDKDLDFTMNTKIDNWPMDQTDNLWPQTVMADAREWVMPNLRRGQFDHLEAVFKGNLNWKKLNEMNITEGKGKLAASGAEVHYIDGMPPVQGVDATATFDLKQMAVQINNGHVDNLKVVPFTVTITGLDQYDQFIDIPLNMTGPVPDLMRLIDNPPLEYAKALELGTDDINGNVAGVVNLNFPLLKALAMKDIALKATASLSNIASTKLVPGLDLSQGTLQMDLTKQGFALKGGISVNKVPMQITWAQNFNAEDGEPTYKSNVSGTVDGEQWALLGIDTLRNSHGPSKVSLDLTQLHKASLHIAGNVDMKASAVSLDIANWKKLAGAPAVLNFTAELPPQGLMKISNLDLSGEGISVKGKAELTRDASKFVSFTFSPFILGRSNATLHMVPLDDAEKTVHVDADGKALDVVGMLGGNDEDKHDTAPQEYRLKIGKLYTSTNGVISNATGHMARDKDGWNEISLQGQVNNEHPLDIELTPKGDIRIFRMTCDDFGKALQGLGFTDTVRDGNMEIRGESTKESPHTINGTIKIGHFQVKDLPVLALLLNATSPFGIIGIMTDSVDFDHLTGNFQWEGDKIRLDQVNASGSAIGINVEGNISLQSGAATLDGTIVPFSMVNRIIGYIPLIGDLITGGEGQGVLAVAYKISGYLDDPRVVVNPVSLLTPGFIRNLFFGSDSNDEEKKDSGGKRAVPKGPAYPGEAGAGTQSNINRH